MKTSTTSQYVIHFLQERLNLNRRLILAAGLPFSMNWASYPVARDGARRRPGPILD